MVHAVEPSDAMRWLGQQIEQRSKAMPERENDSSEDWSEDDFEGPSESGNGNQKTREEEHELYLGEATPHTTADGRHTIREAEAASTSEPNHAHPSQVGSLHRDTDASEEAKSSRVIIGQGLASPESSFGRSWSIRWLQHLQGFGDRRQLLARRPGSRNPRRPTWVQSTGNSQHNVIVYEGPMRPILDPLLCSRRPILDPLLCSRPLHCKHQLSKLRNRFADSQCTRSS